LATRFFRWSVATRSILICASASAAWAAQHVGFALLDLGLEQGGIEFGQHLVFLHPVVEIGVDFTNGAGHLGADIDQHHRVEGAVGGDGLDDVAAIHGLGAVAFGGLGFTVGPIAVCGDAGGEDQADEQNRGFGERHRQQSVV
jgi:hypothetical protein